MVQYNVIMNSLEITLLDYEDPYKNFFQSRLLSNESLRILINKFERTRAVIDLSRQGRPRISYVQFVEVLWENLNLAVTILLVWEILTTVGHNNSDNLRNPFPLNFCCKLSLLTLHIKPYFVINFISFCEDCIPFLKFWFENLWRGKVCSLRNYIIN